MPRGWHRSRAPPGAITAFQSHPAREIHPSRVDSGDDAAARRAVQAAPVSLPQSLPAAVHWRVDRPIAQWRRTYHQRRTWAPPRDAFATPGSQRCLDPARRPPHADSFLRDRLRLLKPDHSRNPFFGHQRKSRRRIENPKGTKTPITRDSGTPRVDVAPCRFICGWSPLLETIP